MQPGTAITFNHDTNEVVEVTFHALASPVCTPVANLSYLMWVKNTETDFFYTFRDKSNLIKRKLAGAKVQPVFKIYYSFLAGFEESFSI